MIPIIQRQKRVAIEIGSNWIKLAESVWTPAGYKVSRFRTKRSLDIKDDLSVGLKALLKEMDIKTKSIILVVPRYFTTVRNLELPSTDQNEIREIVDLQVSKQTPYSRDEIIFGIKVIKGAKEGYSNVLLVIAKKNIIEERLKVLRESDLEPVSVRISSEMVYQNFLLSEQYKNIGNKTAVIIDIDGYYSDILVVSRGSLVFTRNISIGKDFILKSPDNWKERFTEEIRRSLELYQHEASSGNIENILFAGAVSDLTDLLTFTRTSFNLPADIIKPLGAPLFFKRIISSPNEVTDDVSLSALLGALCSSQEPDINLFPQEAEIERQMKCKAKNITYTGALSVSILILLSAFLLERFYTEKHYYDTLHAKFLKSENEAAEVEKMKIRVNTIRKYLDKENSTINILRELFVVKPEQIYFKNINYIKNKEVILTGVSEKMSDIFKFVTVLEELDCFEKVETNYATKKGKEDKETVDFELVCPLVE